VFSFLIAPICRKEAVVFGTRGMHYNDGTQAGYIPYSTFPMRTFGVVRGKDIQVTLGRNEIVDINGSKADVRDFLGALEPLKGIANERQRRMQRGDVLPPRPGVGESACCLRR